MQTCARHVKLIFQQDGACPNTSLETQVLLEEKIPHFWRKDQWPANSPDLSPIENLWSILGDKVDEQNPKPTSIVALQKCLKKAWRDIPLETLENLYQSMPGRIKAVLDAKEHFPVKLIEIYLFFNFLYVFL